MIGAEREKNCMRARRAVWDATGRISAYYHVYSIVLPGEGGGGLGQQGHVNR
jgi:hypothetical protein